VSSQYPALASSFIFAAVAGGFSSARIWRLTMRDGREFCLKSHPPAADPNWLEQVIHPWMRIAHDAGLDFVPQVERTKNGRTVTEHAGRPWELSEWMPGRADFHANPTDERLVDAVQAVARIHDAWRGRPASGPCPAIERRWKALLDWKALVNTGWRPRPASDDPMAPRVEAAWQRLPASLTRMPSALLPWLTTPVPVQPCLCDIWHDHVLFTGDRVTGVIDYAAAKVDHVAVDLARLLGSLIPGDRKRTVDALRAYEAIRPLSHPELVDLLDWTGAVVGLTNWLRWLYHDGRTYPDRAVVATRFGALLDRLS
jgi:Ser/Thr protein kinase RdoA (MazF antagonist)